MHNKTIGVLGGMGPIATVNFLKTVIDRTKADKDWEHVHMVVDFDTTIPSRGRHIMLGEESPVIGMRSACFKLMSVGCSKIFVPCNSAHYFYNDVVRQNEIPWVNMLEIVAAATMRYNKVLVLGAYTTIIKRSYDHYMKNTIYLDNNSSLFGLIEKIKIAADYTLELSDVLSMIYRSSADCVLLACTELPIALSEHNIKDIKVVDAGMLYVEELIRSGGASVRE